jgi:hypothetical protein
MKRAIVLAATLIVSPVVVPLCMAQGSASAVGEEDAHAIGVAAYLYFYPLVTMDLTPKQLTNIEPDAQFFFNPAFSRRDAQALGVAVVAIF